MNVPRTLMSCIRSYFFSDNWSEPDRSIALALFTTMSMPPKSALARATASAILASSRTSPTTGSAVPPAARICSAAVKMVPSKRGCGCAVFASKTTLAPSCATRRAMASPTPRLPPEISIVFPLRFMPLVSASRARSRPRCGHSVRPLSPKPIAIISKSL